MSIFTDTGETIGKVLYIVPDSMAESEAIEFLSQRGTELSIEIIGDDTENLFHIEIRKKQNKPQTPC